MFSNIFCFALFPVKFRNVFFAEFTFHSHIRKADPRPFVGLKSPTTRTFHVPFFHCSGQIFLVNLAWSLINRRWNLDFLFVPEGRCPFFRQFDRISFCPGAGRITINLIHQDDPHRTGSQAWRGICPGYCDMSAGECFM